MIKTVSTLATIFLMCSVSLAGPDLSTCSPETLKILNTISNNPTAAQKDAVSKILYIHSHKVDALTTLQAKISAIITKQRADTKAAVANPDTSMENTAKKSNAIGKLDGEILMLKTLVNEIASYQPCLARINQIIK